MISLRDEPHHDGSPVYVEAGARTLGSTVRVRLRVPDVCGTTRVRLRSTPDAEPAIDEASIERRDDGVTWWAADLVLHNPQTRYRWLLDGGTLGRCWVNGAGVFHRDVTDDADFRLTAQSPEPGSRGTQSPEPGPSGTELSAAPPPAWLADTVGYQIFIDRFANSGAPRATPEWAIPRQWAEPVDDTRGIRARHWYGGDLAGVEQRLDHLTDLGVTLIYLTPFFPAGSMHRYDASTFDHVDPALGGDEALASLVAAAHERGIRVIGDITLNHTGVHHDWFRAASADTDAVERSFYFFDDTEPEGYVAWHGVPTLPKLDHRSAALRERFYDGADSVVARYLREPFGLDGWRVDCANTTARFRAHDHNSEVARLTRATMRAVEPDSWLVAEHCYDSGDDLDGTGWHGVMAYQWFTRPLWAWLKDHAPRSLMSAVELIELDGHGLVESMRHLSANVSWEARQASMTMLDSHDTARFRTVVGGDVTRHIVGLVALLTMPGVPTLFAGSEVGCEGDSIDTTRVPFPWDVLASIDEQRSGVEAQFVEDVRTLVALRRRSDALRHGSMRWIDATSDSVTYVRDSDTETLLVHLVRRPCGERTFNARDVGTIEEFGADGGGTVEFGDRDLIETTPARGGTEATIVLPGVPGAYVVSCARR
jgi:alpha-glucosidase